MDIAEKNNSAEQNSLTEQNKLAEQDSLAKNNRLAINKQIRDIRIGDNSDLGDEITRFYYRTDDYIIYETKNLSNVAYTVSDINKYDSSAIINQLILTTSLFEEEDKPKYANRLASAYRECFEGRPENGIEIIKSIEKIFVKRKIIKNRLFYVVSATIFVMINVLFSIILSLLNFNGVYETLKLLFIIATFGSIGGVLSISLKLKNLDLDIEGNHKIHIITALSRIIISMICSIVIYEMIKANFIFGLINKSTVNHFYVFAVLAGFSESFIPNVLKSIETKTVDVNEKENKTELINKQ